MTHVDAEQSGHPVQVVGVVGHAQHFGHDGVLGPHGSELLHQLHQVAGGRLADGVDCKDIQRPRWRKHHSECGGGVGWGAAGGGGV